MGKLLLSAPDLLLLDEPTNHIDLTSLEWLESFINDYRGSAVIISHDRYFLDKVTTKTMLLENGKIEMFNGGYSRFLEQKTERDEIERRHYERQMDEVHRLEGIIEQQRRWRHFITADSKQKMLDKSLRSLTRPTARRKLSASPSARSSRPATRFSTSEGFQSRLAAKTFSAESSFSFAASTAHFFSARTAAERQLF